MPRDFNPFDVHEEFSERDEPNDVRCNRCGQGGLHWRRVTAADGRSEKSVLFTDSMSRHICKPSADDFDTL
jgi:hypothetical protein